MTPACLVIEDSAGVVLSEMVVSRGLKFHSETVLTFSAGSIADTTICC